MKTQQKSILALLFLTFSIVIFSCSNSKNEKDGNEATSDTLSQASVIYSCPMHAEVIGKEGEKCPKCGMDLEPMEKPLEKGNFEMTFTSLPEKIIAQKQAQLIFKPVNKDVANSEVPLDIEHEKKIHLIIVNENLTWFDHIHPEFRTDGSYMVEETFPSGGNYFMYSDYKPAGAAHQLEKTLVTVEGAKSTLKELSKQTTIAKSDDFEVTLIPDEDKFYAKKSLHFDGVFKRSGKDFDVNNLQNYLGAKGHMVGIQTETKEYMHIHPEVEGTKLHFHTTFEKAGNYRVWLQFMMDDKIHTVDYLIHVE